MQLVTSILGEGIAIISRLSSWFALANNNKRLLGAILGLEAKTEEITGWV